MHVRQMEKINYILPLFRKLKIKSGYKTEGADSLVESAPSVIAINYWLAVVVH